MLNARRARISALAAATAAISLAALWAPGASASSPYTLKLAAAPKTAPLPGAFKVTASGSSSNTSRLEVFLNATKPCAATAAVEAKTSGDVLELSTTVVHSYSKSKTLVTLTKVGSPQGPGSHQACAYLLATAPSSLQRAKANAPYAVKKPSGGGGSY
jgi:hypothetical protein